VLKVAILPIGQVDKEALQFIQHGLKDVFPETEVILLETVMPIPREAYNSSRQQYHSTNILIKMNHYVKGVEAQYVLGVTEADLYVPNLNFVFGEAQHPGKIALISMLRLKPEFYGESSDNQLFRMRTLKEAVHEIGHALGLGHCPSPLCVMFFSNSIRDTDRKSAKFCDDCHLLVHRVLENRVVPKFLM